MEKIKKAIDRVTSAFTLVSGVMFAIIVLIVIINIVGRATANKPVRGAIEIVQLGMLLSVGIVMCRSGFDERHICVALVIDTLPGRGRAALIALSKIISAAVFGMISYLFWTNVPEAIRLNKVSDTFRLPYEYVYLVLMICFVMGALVFLYQFLAALSIVIHGVKSEELLTKQDDGQGPNDL